MQVRHWIVPALLVAPGVARGQSAPAAWALTAGVDQIRFAAAARATEAAPGQAVNLRPNGRTGLRSAPCGARRGLGRERREHGATPGLQGTRASQVERIAGRNLGS